MKTELLAMAHFVNTPHFLFTHGVLYKWRFWENASSKTSLKDYLDEKWHPKFSLSAVLHQGNHVLIHGTVTM